MSSNLKVNTILPSTGTSIGIGTAGGDTAISGAASVDTNLTLGGDIIHSGDDTKIRFPSNDLITFETAGSERFRIADAASTLQNKLIIDDGSNGHLFLNNTSSENTIHSGTTGFAAYKNLAINAAQHIFKVSNQERLRIDNDGRLLVGQTSAGNGVYGSPPPRFSVSTTTASPAIFATYSNDNYASRIDLIKSRSGTVGGTTIVQSGDATGEIVFGGADGDQFHPTAIIQSVVESGVGNNDMPGALLFYTNAGATTASERLRITSGGQVNIGGLYTQTSYGFSVRGGAVDQNVQFSNTKSTNGDIHYFGITLTNAGYGQALFGHTGHTTQSEQAAWIGLAGDDVAGGVGVKCFRGGNVIKKGTCAFQAYNGSSQINQSSYVIFTTAGFNIGGNYNTSNGIFTAPITGRYLFTLTGLYTKNNSSATFKLVWHVNNSNSGVAAEYQTSNLNGSYNTIGTSSIIFQLSANDTVRLYVEGVGAFHVSGTQTRFCGYLLG